MIRFSPMSRSMLGLSLLFGSVAAMADDAPPAINSGDTAFVALCSLVVLLMTLPERDALTQKLRERGL